MDGSEIPGSEVDPEEERVKEIEDHIELNGVTFHKPFVEKPVSAENHNIVIYFPSGVGGGCQKLFRKIGNKSSMYSKESSIRRTGSYIYEEYLPTDGVDVKVYAVGPFYAHAEARKSPGLDGKVERDRQGKEIRYPVILSNAEKMIARRVVLAFQQNVCGFDLLRSNGKSYVCDVNGFSFVKNSVKYYDDTSNILGNMIMRRLAPSLQIPWTPHYQIEDPPLAQTTTGKLMELRCVLSVIRHGDRTPKQKMKMEVRHPRFFDLFRTYGGFKKGQLKLKRPNHLQEVLDLARELLATLNTQNEDAQLLEANGDQDPVSASLPSVSPCNEAFIHHTDSDDLKTPQVRLGPPQLVTNAISTLAIPEILDTPLGSSTLPDQSKSGSVSAHELTNYLMAVAAETDTGDGVEKNGGAKLGAPSSAADGDLQDSSRSEAIVDTGNGQCEVDEMRAKLEQIKDVLEMYGHFSGLNRKVQMKYLSFGAGAPHSGSEGTGGMGGGYYTSSNEAAKDEQREPSILLILKWGGELTPAGRIQAEELGKAFRGLYPGTGEEGDLSLGFLRLHSTYRHDLRIYASEEGRVQSTAGAFTKGLLALEGEITPILVQMVKSANTSGLLEDCQNSRRMQSTANAFLSDYLQQNIVLGPEDYARLNPTGDKSIQRSLECIRNPYEMCERIFGLICKLVASIHQRRISCQRNGSVSDTHFYVNESLILMSQRWSKLKRDFRRVKKGKVIFDISKLPDIYDNAKYCYQHNARAIQFDQIDTLYLLSKNMADVIVPLEYGISRSEKLKIGEGICTPLLEKIKLDLQQSIAGDSEEESTTKLDPRYSEDIATPMRHVRTRLYFTSKSHIHSMMNLLRYGDLLDEQKDKQWRRATEFLSCVTEYNYMSQLVFMLYEDSSKEPDSDDRFHVEIHFSPGALPCIQTTDLKQLGYRSRLNNDNKSVSGLPEDDGEDNSEHHSIITTSGTTPDTPMGAKFELGEPSSVGSPMKIPEIIAENNTACEMEDHRLRSPLPHRMAGQESFDDNAMNVVGSTQDRNILVVESQSLHREEMSSADSEALKNMHLNSATIHSGYFLTPDSATGSAAQLNQDKRSASVATMEPGNKLISTAVISGKHRNSAVEPSTMVEEKPIGSNEVDEGMGSSAFDPTLENTSVVVVRKSSLPDRVSPNESSTDFAHKASDSTKTDDGSRSQHNNISEFVPPLRSLETLHNRLSYRQLAAWIDKHTEAAHCNSTSPPRSPLSRELSAFDLNPTNVTAGKTKGKENA